MRMQKPGRFLMVILGAAVLLLAIGIFGERNRQALILREVCLMDVIDRSAIDPAEFESERWFAAMLAYCSDPQASTQAWRTYLLESDARLTVIQALAPDRLALAALAAERYPDNPAAHYWLAEILDQAGDDLAAVAAYERVVALDAGQGEAWVRIGLIYAQLDQPDKALAAYEQACRVVDPGRNGCLRAGQIHLEQADYELALARFEMTNRQLGYALPQAELGRARALFGLGDLEQALAVAVTLAESGNRQAIKLVDEIQEQINR